MSRTSLASAAARAGFGYLEVPLRCGTSPKKWICPRDGTEVGVERAVLSHFMQQGWRGFSGEGGLVLNLIKAMSFERLPLRSRTTFVEAIYAQNVAFEDDRYDRQTLLAQVARATPAQIGKNFDLMVSRGPFVETFGCVTHTSTTSILDFFPGLEPWMLVELLDVAGVELILRIASIFAEDPYEYRNGWPDITMWRDKELRFVEVKAPGDALGKSQRTIAASFAIPLRLRFELAGVRCT